MKQLLTLICLYACIFTASAQTTLYQYNHPANAGITERARGLKVDSTLKPQYGTNKTFDFRTAKLSGDSLPSRKYVATTDTINFPGSNRTYMLGFGFAGIPISMSYYEQNNAAAHSLIGFSMTRQAFDLSGLTTSKGDSLIFIKQAHLFKHPHTILKYPATFHSAWGYTDRVVTDFQITIQNFGYDHTPCQRVFNIVHSDSVAAWGQMLVPFDSTGSAAYDVLMVKYMEKVNDSFYTNGKATNLILLSAIGKNNGQDTFNYGYRFYRPYFSAPLATITMDSGYKHITGMYYDPDHISTTGIEKMIAGVSKVSVFPNPSKDGNFTLSFQKYFEGTYKISIMNATGQTVLQTNSSGTGNIQKNIALPQSATGLYFYSITSGSGEKLSSGKLMIVK